MIAPDLSFQTAVRAALISDAAITGLVPAHHIRAGSTRPDNLPCIIMANPDTEHLGRDAAGFYLSRVHLDLHIWALDDGADYARQIGAAVAAALWDCPAPAQNDVSAYVRPSFAFIRDPDPERAYCHGVGHIAGVVRWQL